MRQPFEYDHTYISQQVVGLGLEANVHLFAFFWREAVLHFLTPVARAAGFVAFQTLSVYTHTHWD